jgi:hypothetical protein
MNPELYVSDSHSGCGALHPHVRTLTLDVRSPGILKKALTGDSSNIIDLRVLTSLSRSVNAFIEFMRKSTSLTALEIRSQGVHNKILQSVCGNDNLRSLKLQLSEVAHSSRNKLNEISKLSNLERLRIEVDESDKEFCPISEQNRKLTHLRFLCENYGQKKTTIGIVQKISTLPNLKSLCVDLRKDHDRIMDSVKVPNLEQISLMGFSENVEFLLNCNSLKKISFHLPNYKNFDQFCKILKNNQNLEKLNLNFTGELFQTVEQFESTLELLKNFPIKILRLNSVTILNQKNAKEKFVQFLLDSKLIEELELAGNQMIFYLELIRQKKYSLKKLKIFIYDRTQISQFILQFSDEKCPLKYLAFPRGFITGHELGILGKLLTLSKNLEYLDLGLQVGNISSEIIFVIGNYLKQNLSLVRWTSNFQCDKLHNVVHKQLNWNSSKFR